MFIFIKIIVFLLGLSVGSFLNCITNRIEKEESISGRSYCPKCNHKLYYYDLLPILSFVLLKGKCRYCKEKISFQYPLIEIITAILFLLIFNNIFISLGLLFNFWYILELILLFIIFSFLILIFIYDLKHSLIPDFATYFAIFFAFIYNLLIGNTLNGIISGFISFFFFLFIFLVTKKRGMGFGDVKLSFFLGLFLGYPNFLLALFTSFLIGAIIGLALIFLKKKEMKSEIPFGPFLIIGILISFFYGEEILYYYFNSFVF